MTFQYFVRRSHLYMGLFLLPWVVMFGVSSIPLNHNTAPDPPRWIHVANRPFDAEIPATGTDLRPLGRQMMDAAGVGGGYFVNRVNPQQVNVNHPSFLRPIRISYYAGRKQVLIEQRELALRSFISGLHTRGGYDLDGFWDSIWAIFVDVVSAALILWIASGLYMWWHLPVTRSWGWIALAAGAACFMVIILTL
jgi:hypothetical protein